MHDTAMRAGKLFFELYVTDQWCSILDFGAFDVNGSLRSVCPKHIFYIGADVEFGRSVDIKVNINEPIPFRDNFVDCVISSSQMEHDDFFWLTFLEFVRVTKEGGFIYINAPSNGSYHRYPNDNWRFYPDCEHVLVRWAAKNGYTIELVESFTQNRIRDKWNDFIMVFVKGTLKEERASYLSDKIECRNVWKWHAQTVEKPSPNTEDMDIIKTLRAEIADLKAAAAPPIQPRPTVKPDK